MIPFIDMHCDTVSAIHNRRLSGETVSLEKNDLHNDLEKLAEGGCMCQNFAMYTYLGDWMPGMRRHPGVTEDRYPTPGDYARALLETLGGELRNTPEKIAPVLTTEDIAANFRSGKISALRTIEEGAVYGGSTDALKAFYDLGVRMTTLTWNFENELGFPNRIDRERGTVEPDTENGLKPAGKDIVACCKDLGVVVDISHLNDAGIWDVFDVMNGTPFVASHSNARAVTPHPRNLTDAMLKKLADCGGVTGINFCADFTNTRNDEMTLISDLVRHIKYIENVAGIDAIGLGSDHDGIGNRLEHVNAGGMQLIAEALEKEGYSVDKIEKIFYKNVLRVYKEILG